MQKDKILHFSASAALVIIMMTIFFICNSNWVLAALAGTAVSATAGITKEYADSLNPNNKWDWKDIIADALGISAGLLISSLLWII